MVGKLRSDAAPAAGWRRSPAESIQDGAKAESLSDSFSHSPPYSPPFAGREEEFHVHLMACTLGDADDARRRASDGGLGWVTAHTRIRVLLHLPHSTAHSSDP